MGPRDTVPGVMALFVILTASILTGQVEGFGDFVFSGGSSVEDSLSLLKKSSVFCPHDQVFCFVRNKCVKEDGSCLPGEEPTCTSLGQAVCKVGDELMCIAEDACSRTDLKFALEEEFSLTEFYSGYNSRKYSIETALETAIGASPTEIYAVDFHWDEDRTVYVTVRADPKWHEVLKKRFEEKQQFLYDPIYNNVIAIDWEKSHPPQAVNPLKKECGPDETFCLETGRCEYTTNPCDDDDDDDGVPNKAGKDVCLEGQTFCLETGRCEYMKEPCDDDDDRSHHEKPKNICHTGQTFCLETGRCEYMKEPCDHDDEPHKGKSKDICHMGQTFCLETGRCEYMKEPCDDDDEPHKGKPKDICHMGQTFCLETGRCEYMKQPCDDDDEPHKGKSKDICHMGQTFCLETGRCEYMKEPCGHDDDEPHKEKPKNICHMGQTFCLETGRCEYMKEPCDDDDDPGKNKPKDICHMGQTFCLETGRCEYIREPCDDNDDDPHKDKPKDICYIGQTFCLETGRCEYMREPCNDDDDDKPHKDKPKNICHIGQTFCLETGRCEYMKEPCDDDDDDPHKDKPKNICHMGQTFCLETGTCEYMKEPCDDDDDDPHKDKPKGICHFGQTFCLETGRCEYVKEPCKHDDEYHHTENRKTVCLVGQTFCFETGKCEYMREPCDDDDDDDDDGPHKDKHKDTCHIGQTFCLETGRCEYMREPCDDDDDDPYKDKPKDICHLGQTFCLETGRCEYMREPCDDDDDKPHKDKPKDTCHLGQTFCLETGRCEYMREPCDDDDDKPHKDKPKDICHMGQTFCLETGRCEYMRVPCDDDDDKPHKDKPKDICHIGQTFCLETGRCEYMREPCDDDDDDKPHKDKPKDTCHLGQTFCLETGRCEYMREPCDDDDDKPHKDKPKDICHMGQTFCLETGRCEYMREPCDDDDDDKPHKDKPKDTCHMGQTFCLETGRCEYMIEPCDDDYDDDDEPHKDKPKDICHMGQTFCLETGRCEYMREPCDDDDDEPHKDKPKNTCHIGQTFCLETGRCEYMREPCDDDDDDDDDDDKPHKGKPRDTCHIGQTFCLETGRCEYMREPCDDDYDDDDEPHKDKPKDTCHIGQTFCLETGRCEYMREPCDDDDDDKPHKGKPKDICHMGQTFCLETGRCEYMREPCDDDDDDKPHKDKPKDTCHIGQTFCLETGRCEYMREPCDDDDDDDDDKPHKDKPKDICHIGQTFCLETGRCEYMREPCDDDDDDDDKPHKGKPRDTCHIGQTFCLETGRCEYMREPCDDDYDDDDEPHKDKPKDTCHSGQTFCLETGRCEYMREPCDDDDDDDEPHKGKPKDICHMGQTFCLETGRCEYMKEPCDDDDDDDDGDSPPKEDKPKDVCHKGQTFCLETGKCEYMKEPCDDDDDDYNDPNKDKPKTVCYVGQTFCLETGRCEYMKEPCDDGEEDDDDTPHKDDKPKDVCLVGEIFCLEKGKCEPVREPCDDDDDDDDGDDVTHQVEKPKDVCNVGQIFCLEKGKCEPVREPCDDDDDDDDNIDDSQPEIKPKDVCNVGQIFCLETGKCEADICDDDEDDDDLCPDGQGVWCNETQSCVEEGQCNVVQEKDTFIIWASLSGDQPFFDVVAPNRLGLFEEQFATFKSLARSRLESVFSALSTGPSFTSVSIVPGNDDGSTTVIAAIAEADTDTYTEATLKETLVGLNIQSDLQVAEVLVWKTHGSSAAVQIVPSTEKLVSGMDVPVEMSFLPEDISSALKSLTLSCQAEGGIQIKQNDNYVRTADFTDSMILKATTSEPKLANCEILNLPAEITGGTRKYYIGFIILNDELSELSKISSFTTTDLTLEEDAPCQSLPQDLLTVGRGGEGLVNLLVNRPPWPEEMTVPEVNWMDLHRFIGQVESILLHYFQERAERMLYSVATLAVKEGNDEYFNGEPVIRFEFLDEESTVLERSQLLRNPQVFKYCVAKDFSGTLELEVSHYPSSAEEAVKATITVEVNPSPDKPVGRSNVEDVITEFSYPAVADSVEVPEFNAGDLANLWFDDIDTRTDPDAVLTVGVLGSITEAVTVSGSWEYGTMLSTGSVTWEPIPSAPNPRNLDTTSANSVQALLLTHDTKLRFTPDTEYMDTTWVWITAPALVVFGWDESNIESLSDLSQVPVTATKCRKVLADSFTAFCLSDDSYSSEIKMVKLTRVGCDGITNSGNEDSRCGCGEDKDSCIDCNDVPNGGASLDVCGICVDPTAGDVPHTSIDCNESVCRENNLELCLKEEVAAEQIAAICPEEGETINACYNESSSLYNSPCTTGDAEPVDNCGVKCGHNECFDCENTKDGEKILNSCGNCVTPAVGDQGCVNLGLPKPLLSFAHGTVNVSVKAPQSSVSTESPTITCSFVPVDSTEGQVTPAVTAVIYTPGSRKITVTASVSFDGKQQSVGKFHITCNIDGVEVSTLQPHQRYWFPTLETVTPAVIDSSSTEHQEITINGAGFYDTGSIFCIIPYKGKYKIARATRVSDTQIKCDIQRHSKSLGGSAHDLYVILENKKKMEQELPSLSNPLTIRVKLGAPILKYARFHKKNCQRIIVRFNVRIARSSESGTGDCSDFLDPASMAKLDSATCKLSGGNLIINGAGSNLINTTLSVSNIKQEKETSDSPNIFAGDVTIQPPENLVIPEVKFNPNIPNQIGCKKRRVSLRISQKRCWICVITWSVTAEDASDPDVQTKLDELTSHMSGKNAFFLKADQLPDIPVTIQASWTLTHRQTEAVNSGVSEITLRKNTTTSIALTISGINTIVSAFDVLKPKGGIDGCISDAGVEVTRIWELHPVGKLWLDTNRPKIKLHKYREIYHFIITLNVTVGSVRATKSVSFSKAVIEPVAVIRYEGEIASGEESARLEEDLQLTCENTADTAVSVIWTGEDNRYGPQIPILDVEQLAEGQYQQWQFEGADLVIPGSTLTQDGLIQEWTCNLRQPGTDGSEASTRIVFSETSTLTKPVINTPSGDVSFRLNAANKFLKIRTFCMYVTSYEWYSDPSTDEEALFTDNKVTNVVGLENGEELNCFLTLDLTSVELSPDVAYPVSLMATNELNGESVVTLQNFKVYFDGKPSPGTVEAVFEGNSLTALTQAFTLVLDGWEADGDDATDLRCMVYYYAVGSTKRRRVTNTHISADESIPDVTIPEGEFYIEATCCNPLDMTNLCTTVTMERTLTATAPVVTSYLTILNTIEIKLKTGDATFIEAIVSVKLTATLTVEETERTETLANGGILEELNTMNGPDVDFESFIEGLDNIHDLTEVLVGGIEAQVLVEIRISILTAVRSATGQGTSRRRKRDTCTPTQGMPVSQVETLFTTFFDNAVTGEPVEKETAEAFKEVIDFVMQGLCKNHTGTSPWVAGSRWVTVRVNPMSLSGQAATEYTVSCDGCTTINDTAKVTYGADIVSIYGSNEVCVASAQVLVDMYAPTGTALHPTRVSDIVVLKLINLACFTSETVTNLTSQSVITTLILTNETINSTAYDYVCLMWDDTARVWSDGECSESDPVLDGSTSKYSVQCSCNALGIVGVFRQAKQDSAITTTTPVPTSSSTTVTTSTNGSTTSTSSVAISSTSQITAGSTVTTTTAPSVPLASSTIHVLVVFTFTNNFAVEVTDLQAFISLIKSQLSTQSGISTASFINMVVEPGSILVTFELHAFSSSSLTLGQMLYMIQNGIVSGSITLTSPSGTVLTLQAGSFAYQEVAATSSTDSDSGSDNTGIIVGAVLGGLAIIGVAVAVVVFIVKKYGQPKAHTSRTVTPSSSGYDPPPAYSDETHVFAVPPPPLFLYQSPSTNNKAYPESNKWIENELAKGLKPDESSSRPSSRGSVNRMIGSRNETDEPTPVD